MRGYWNATYKLFPWAKDKEKAALFVPAHEIAKPEFRDLCLDPHKLNDVVDFIGYAYLSSWRKGDLKVFQAIFKSAAASTLLGRFMRQPKHQKHEHAWRKTFAKTIRKLYPTPEQYDQMLADVKQFRHDFRLQHEQ